MRDFIIVFYIFMRDFISILYTFMRKWWTCMCDLELFLLKYLTLLRIISPYSVVKIGFRVQNQISFNNKCIQYLNTER